jgi:hypothetical protein
VRRRIEGGEGREGGMEGGGRMEGVFVRGWWVGSSEVCDSLGHPGVTREGREGGGWKERVWVQ